MRILTNPQNYDICFTIASLLLILVILITHLAEDMNYSRQKSAFGALIFDAFVLNFMGLLHNIWMDDAGFKGIFSSDVNSAFVIFEKISAYFIAYLSIRYIMTLFHIESESVPKKILLIVPAAYSTAFFLTGFVSEIFFRFNENGELKYIYPQGATVNFGIILYLIYAAYLCIKYARSLSTEKITALIIYYIIMLAGIPIRIFTKSSSIFEFSVSIGLLLCVYTFENPSEFVDRLSGAGTRNALDFAASTRLLQKKKFAMLGIYVDRLALVVTSESIETGADLLAQVVNYLKQLCPEGNLFNPKEGHFIMIFDNASADDEIITKACEQIKRRFRDSWNYRDGEIKFGVSPYAIGFPDEVDTMDKFYEVRTVIDRALLRHNREILRVEDLSLKHVEHDKKIDNIVKHALEDGLLEVYYQPIYSPKEGRFTSCEALLRLKDPQLGFISPAVFMPIAERNGKALAIDSFVLSSVCEMIATTDAMSHGLEYVEVNLSVIDCIQANLSENVLKTLKKYNVKPEQINLEITETYDEGITSAMDKNVRELMDEGIEFSMDDFGTGYSNVARVATLPVKLFKLDKSIIQAAFDSETAYMVMYNLIKIIRSLDKEIVAEGVETAEQAKQIIKLGCDHIQGFYYARPMPQKQFLDFLVQHNN